MTAHHSSVRRLRLQGAGFNPLMERCRVEAALEEARIGLPSEAILCVRRVKTARTRLPSLATTLEKEKSAAARPAHGPIPAGANAVLFADRAEMLACMARDWCHGDGETHWWWKLLFPRHDFQKTVRETWLQEMRLIPAALARLDLIGLASRFLSGFSSEELGGLWSKLVTEFELAELSPPEFYLGESDKISEAVPERFSGTIPESARRFLKLPSGVRADVQRVLTVALLLERAPAVVRSSAFAREWHARLFGSVITRQPDPVRQKPDTILLSAPPPITRFAREDSRNAATVESVAPIFQPLKQADEHTIVVDFPPTETTAPSEPITLRESESALPPPPSRARSLTEWGGAFYLVNVALALGWYGDFTTPAQPGLALPLWDFLELLGDRMCGGALEADPLAGLLASLSNRSADEPPGHRFNPPEGKTRWLDKTHDQTLERLTLALGVADAVELSTLVLRHRARIETDCARVDVWFSLTAHPIELRIAGLDRDPGWVAAGGRTIAFHYD